MRLNRGSTAASPHAAVLRPGGSADPPESRIHRQTTESNGELSIPARRGGGTDCPARVFRLVAADTEGQEPMARAADSRLIHLGRLPANDLSSSYPDISDRFRSERKGSEPRAERPFS